MTRKLLVLACTAAVALAACKQEAPPPAEPVEPVASESAPAEAATPTLTPTGPANPGSSFDQKGFAGVFSGTLPCADCPGIDATLQLNADGSYSLTETYQGEEGISRKSEGTWTPESDGKQIRLDPASKSDQDRLYAISSDDEIVQLGLDGQPAESGLDYSLQREDATPVAADTPAG